MEYRSTQMKRIFNCLHAGIMSLILGFSSVLNAQIFEPQGLNMPGTWNNFANPPLTGSVFGSSTQVNGSIQPISTGAKRWQTRIGIAPTGADVGAGTYTFLFTSL